MIQTIKAYYKKHFKQKYYKLKNKIYKLRGYEQFNNATESNRYPEIFSHCTKLIHGKGVKILSFGCSVGLECFSLNNYFPDSPILGYDINKSNISIAKGNNNYSNIIFTSDYSFVKSCGKYDLVFAMSVLCRFPETLNTTDCSTIYPFDNFKKKIHQLDSILKVDGLLIIYNSNFRFLDTDISKKYEYIVIPNFKEFGFVPKFSTNNILLSENNEDITDYCIYRKIR